MKHGENITHHERIHDEVIVFEGIESRGRANAVLAWLAELQGRQYRHQHSKHKVVISLHDGWKTNPGRKKPQRRPTSPCLFLLSQKSEREKKTKKKGQ